MKRGEIYFIRSNNKEVGTEQRADRPAVIVSNDEANKYSTAVEVCYMTTKPKKELPTHFITRGGLRPSTVICEQVTTVYNERIGEQIGEISPEEMKQLNECLTISLGIKSNAAGESVADLIRKAHESEKAENEKARKERDFYKDMYEHLAKRALES